MKHFFAAHNTTNFANMWDVYAFVEKGERDAFVAAEADRLTVHGNYVQCKAIAERDVHKYAPTPGRWSGECRVIDVNEPAEWNFRGGVGLEADSENAAMAWWDSGGRELFAEVDGQVLELAEHQAWLARAESIPGWSDGPGYAPYPVMGHGVHLFDSGGGRVVLGWSDDAMPRVHA